MHLFCLFKEPLPKGNCDSQHFKWYNFRGFWFFFTLFNFMMFLRLVTFLLQMWAIINNMDFLFFRRNWGKHHSDWWKWSYWWGSGILLWKIKVCMFCVFWETPSFSLSLQAFLHFKHHLVDYCLSYPSPNSTSCMQSYVESQPLSL